MQLGLAYSINMDIPYLLQVFYTLTASTQTWVHTIIREALMNNKNSTIHSKQIRTWAKTINDCKEAKTSDNIILLV